jgi:Flp pilus assembly protein TadG
MSRRRSTREEGQTMVEFTLVVPILLIVVFAIVQFGILYNDYISLTDATRIGARKAATARHTADPVGVTKAAVRNAAHDLNAADLQIDVRATIWAPGADVTVETSYPYELDVLGVTVASGRLTSSTTERIE